MPTRHTVLVTFSDGSLTVDQPTITLTGPEDWVVWEFDPLSTLPDPNAPLLIVFDPPLGPFQMIRGVGLQTLVAKGNKGDATTVSYSYSLYLNIPNTDTGDTNNLVKSASFTVINQSLTPNISPWVKVTYSEANNQITNVTPSNLLLHSGDIAFFEVEGVPDDFVVAFWFPSTESTEGPFTTYFVTRNDGTGTTRLGAARFDDIETGSLSYGVRIWDADGIFKTSQDPSIDGLGRPPGT